MEKECCRGDAGCPRQEKRGMGQLLPTSWESLVAAKSFISRSEVCREGTIVRHELLRPRQVSRTSRLLSQARSVSPAEQYMRAWSKVACCVQCKACIPCAVCHPLARLSRRGNGSSSHTPGAGQFEAFHGLTFDREWPRVTRAPAPSAENDLCAG